MNKLINSNYQKIEYLKHFLYVFAGLKYYKKRVNKW